MVKFIKDTLDTAQKKTNEMWAVTKKAAKKADLWIGQTRIVGPIYESAKTVLNTLIVKPIVWLWGAISGLFAKKGVVTDTQADTPDLEKISDEPEIEEVNLGKKSLEAVLIDMNKKAEEKAKQVQEIQEDAEDLGIQDEEALDILNKKKELLFGRQPIKVVNYTKKLDGRWVLNRDISALLAEVTLPEPKVDGALGFKPE